MLIATTIMLLGLLVGVAAAQLYGLRLGGVIVVPLVSVYLLWNFATFPVFVASTLAAYASLQFVKRRLLLYGRPLFVLSILVGALVPVTMFEFIALGLGVRRTLTQVEFIGSVLPGIAAYNFHRLALERRVLDAVASLAVVLLLTVVGIGLTIVVGLSPLANFLPPLLLSPESDIATAFGLTVDRQPLPVITSNRLSLGLVALGMGLAESIRSRYGLRIAGVIVIPLVTLIAFRNGQLLPTWIVTTLLAYIGVQLIHRWTLLYGRVLLAAGVILGLIVTISLTTVVPVTHGLLPFFVGLLGGVTAYNFHVVSPAERRATVFVTAGVFVVVTFVTRLFVVPPPSGMLRQVTRLHLTVGGLLLVPALWELFRLEHIRPYGMGRDSEGEFAYRWEGPEDDSN